MPREPRQRLPQCRLQPLHRAPPMESEAKAGMPPGRRRRERIAAVAKGRETRSRVGNMQSASDTPSSHIWSAPRCKGEIAVFGRRRGCSHISGIVVRRRRRPSCPDGIRGHPRPCHSRSLGKAGCWLEQVLGNAGLAFHAITVMFTLRNAW